MNKKRTIRAIMSFACRLAVKIHEWFNGSYLEEVYDPQKGWHAQPFTDRDIRGRWE